MRSSEPGQLYSLENNSDQIGDPERNRIDDFYNLLGRVGIDHADIDLDFHDRNPVDESIKRFIKMKNSSASSLFLSPDISSLVQEATTPTFQPRVARPTHTSHGVFFGDLEIGSTTIPVAVKPHWGDATESCLKDYVNNLAVGKLGIDSLTPVGFVLNSNDQAYSLTVLDESFRTIDSVDWSNFYPDIDKNPGMQSMWDGIARQVAFKDSIGSIGHNDMAGRNIGVTNLGTFMLMDWERSFISTHEPRDAEVRYSYSYPDILCLLESMCRPQHDDFKAGIGIFYGKDGDWWEGFEEMFFDRYIIDRLEYAEQGSHHTNKLEEVKSELVELKRSLRADIKMYRDICADL